MCLTVLTFHTWVQAFTLEVAEPCYIACNCACWKIRWWLGLPPKCPDPGAYWHGIWRQGFNPILSMHPPCFTLVDLLPTQCGTKPFTLSAFFNWVWNKSKIRLWVTPWIFSFPTETGQIAIHPAEICTCCTGLDWLPWQRPSKEGRGLGWGGVATTCKLEGFSPN